MNYPFPTFLGTSVTLPAEPLSQIVERTFSRHTTGQCTTLPIATRLEPFVLGGQVAPGVMIVSVGAPAGVYLADLTAQKIEATIALQREADAAEVEGLDELL